MLRSEERAKHVGGCLWYHCEINSYSFDFYWAVWENDMMCYTVIKARLSEIFPDYVTLIYVGH